AQHGQTIVHEQGACRLESQPLAQSLPKARMLLRKAKHVRADDVIEMTHEVGLSRLHRETVLMRIRNECSAQTSLSQGLQECLGAGQEPHVLSNLTLELGDIERQLPRPVIQAVPIECAS